MMLNSLVVVKRSSFLKSVTLKTLNMNRLKTCKISFIRSTLDMVVIFMDITALGPIMFEL